MNTNGVHPAERGDSRELIRGRVTLGQFEITVLSDGYFLLDGGAMFGVVPKPLWQKRATPDEDNRILLGTNVLVVRDGKRVFVYEQPGTGDVFTIADPALRLDQLEEVQRDVAALLEHGLNPPAPAVENPAPVAEQTPAVEASEGTTPV